MLKKTLCSGYHCPPTTPTYREDTDSCVADIPGDTNTHSNNHNLICSELNLVPWEGGDLEEKIPFIFLPDTGNTLYPRYCCT